MSVDMVHYVLDGLVKQYKRQFPKEGIQKVFPDLVKQPDKALEAAYDWFVLNSAYLPSPAKLLEQVDKEAKRIRLEEAKQRDQEWNREKGGETRGQRDKAGSIFSAEQSSKHAQFSLLMIKGLISGKMDRAMFLEGFKEADKMFLGMDWALNGMQLDKHWKQQAERLHWNPEWNGPKRPNGI